MVFKQPNASGRALKCGICKAALQGRQRKYCCVVCRNTAMGRKPKGKIQFYCFCEVCGGQYTKKKSEYRKSRFCGKKCQGVNLGRIKEDYQAFDKISTSLAHSLIVHE